MVEQLTRLDFFIIFGYFMLVIAIGVWVGLKTKTDDDLFLGGRSLTWGAIGLSLFASNISSSTLIGLSGAAYTTGITSSNYEWLSGVPLMMMAAIFVPIYLKARITTIPEYLALRYDERSRKIFSLVTIITSVLVDMAGGLYAGAMVIQVFFPEFGLWQTAMVLAFVAGLYTAFGGLKAVVYTDALQAIILIFGCSLLTYILFERLDFDWSTVTASVPDGHLSVIKPMDDPTLPWLGTLLGVPLFGFWYWVTNQYVTQRVLAAKSIEHARLGALLGGYLKIVPLFIMVIPGVMAISVMPGIERGDQVFPTLVAEVLPAGVVGLVLTGLISAILSSVDSTLNSASTLIVVDFIKPKKPDITKTQVANYGRVATLVIMVIAALWAPNIANFDGLWSYLQQMFAIIVPPICVIFLGGVFYTKGNANGAFLTLLFGFGLGVAMFALRQAELFNLHYTLSVALSFAICAGVFVVASQFGEPADSAKQADLVYQPGMLAPETSVAWYADYRVHCVALTLAMLLVLWGFW